MSLLDTLGDVAGTVVKPLTPDALAGRRSPVDIVRALVARTPVPAPTRPAG